MDHYLRGVNNGVENEKPVRYFVMGANQWRASDAWPPAAKDTSYYLVSGKSGKLTTTPAESGTSSFISDPAHPVINAYDSSGAHDYRNLAKRSDVLTFDSRPLDHATEVTGPIHARVFVSCDCRDFDLFVRLLDVAPDGTALNLMSPGLDALRASYRDLKQGHQPLTPGQVYELQLDHLITSNVFQKGHRLRVQISPSLFPNFFAQSSDWGIGDKLSYYQEGKDFCLYRPQTSIADYPACGFAISRLLVSGGILVPTKTDCSAAARARYLTTLAGTTRARP